MIDKEKDGVIITMLKEQVDFFKQELMQRNHTIDCLLATVEELVKSGSYLSTPFDLNNSENRRHSAIEKSLHANRNDTENTDKKRKTTF